MCEFLHAANYVWIWMHSKRCETQEIQTVQTSFFWELILSLFSEQIWLFEDDKQEQHLELVLVRYAENKFYNVEKKSGYFWIF